MDELPDCVGIKVRVCCNNETCEKVKLDNATLTYDLFSSPNQKAVIDWENPPKNILLVGKFFDKDAREWMDKISMYSSCEI